MPTPRQDADNLRRQAIQIEKDLTKTNETPNDIRSAFGRMSGLVTIAAMEIECMDPMALLDPVVDEMEKVVRS